MVRLNKRQDFQSAKPSKEASTEESMQANRNANKTEK